MYKSTKLPCKPPSLYFHTLTCLQIGFSSKYTQFRSERQAGMEGSRILLHFGIFWILCAGYLDLVKSKPMGMDMIDRNDLRDFQYAKLIWRYRYWAPASEVDYALDVMKRYNQLHFDGKSLDFESKPEIDEDFVLRIV